MIEIMACRFFCVKTVSEPMAKYRQFDARKRILLKNKSKYNHFIQWNELEKAVYNIAAVSYQCVQVRKTLYLNKFLMGYKIQREKFGQCAKVYPTFSKYLLRPFM